MLKCFYLVGEFSKPVVNVLLFGGKYNYYELQNFITLQRRVNI